jgi:hypothetical protein
MAKARRKMRRQLMKKLKKGYLTPGEREDLMQLDREVNRANRQAAGMTGAGLGSALLIASKMGAGDALGDWLDTRQNKKEVEDEPVEFEESSVMENEDEFPETLDIEEIEEKEEDFQEEGLAGPPLKEQAGPRAETPVDLPEYDLDALIRMQKSVPFPTSLPEAEVQAQGGYTPFLRAVRDRMRKKYGSR